MIKILPQNFEISPNNGSIFEIAKEAGIEIKTACNGVGNCGLCRIKIISGNEFLSPFNDNEKLHLGNVYFITKERLSCQCNVISDGEIIIEIKK